jgi:hypothetical protein
VQRNKKLKKGAKQKLVIYINMNLISNTGLQFFTIPLEIRLNDNLKMYFHEWFDTEDAQLKLEVAHFFSEEEVWVKKHDLALLGYVNNGKVSDNWEIIKDDFDAEGKIPIQIETAQPEDSGCFQESINRIKWDKFENRWLPFPFFTIGNNDKSEFGPTNWCRFKLIPVEANKYDLLLVFDTRTQFVEEGFENEDLYETPVFKDIFDKPKDYVLCNSEFKLVDYCSESFNCEWVDEYVLRLFHNVTNINDLRIQKPKLNYLAQYIFIIRYIQQLDILPKITLYSNKNVAYGNVDLVVDIGNSRTCAVLFDNSDFTKTSPLELQDFTTTVDEGKLNKYTDSFDMRMVFREADFGKGIGRIGSKQFTYPSMVRLGKEANQLTHKATNMNTGAEKTSTFSSPKRFLWDIKPQKQDWEFVQLKGETAKPIYIKGISEQLNTDGSLNTEGNGGILMHYSRKALMTFAFLEILAQAKMQINSYEQRNHWGNETTPRKIGRIIITCPTAMSRIEQIALRKCTEDAAIILDRFFENTYYEQVDEKEIRTKVQVIPSVKNLSIKEERTEWIYDEATCAQFVFLYAEIGKRYLKNVREYFDFYGKARNDLDDYNKKSLTIGSVDIGAGTTDVMIAAYKYDDAGQCTLTPVPLFWESFYKAGDDLLKELIQKLVIEGPYSPIEKRLKTLGKNSSQIVELNNDFFGGDNGMSFSNKQRRKDFNLQVSVPIVSYFLELLKENKVGSTVLSFSDIFYKDLPTQNLLNLFKQHFGFDFDTLQWHYENKIVSAIVEKTFDTLIGKISSLFSHYACDIVLLSGRPTSLKPLTDLFLKYYAISPNRLKIMNDYRVGRWYPEDKRYKFLDGNGKFINPKSIITTGAMIGNYASTRGSLEGFSLNLKELVEKQNPTTEYFGQLNEDTMQYTKTIISPDNNHATVEVMLSKDKPVRFACRQLDTPSYPSRPFYVIDFNLEKIEDRVKGRLDDENDVNAVQSGVENEIDKIIRKCPLKITIERDYNEDRELLRIDSVTTREGEELNKNFLSLQVQSMSEAKDFWLDSGIFSLNINNSNNLRRTE